MTELPPYLVRLNDGYVEYQLPISVKVVIDVNGRVPLLKNSRDEWELPGGKLELGETPEATARREAAEEVGLSVHTLQMLDSWVYEITPTRHVFVVSYGASYRGQEALRISEEHTSLHLFEYAEVRGLTMPSGYKRSISSWFGHPDRKGVVTRPDGDPSVV